MGRQGEGQGEGETYDLGVPVCGDKSGLGPVRLQLLLESLDLHPNRREYSLLLFVNFPERGSGLDHLVHLDFELVQIDDECGRGLFGTLHRCFEGRDLLLADNPA